MTHASVETPPGHGGSGDALAALGTPSAEIDVSQEQVRALLAEQHPDLAELALERTASGWDNVMYRLGTDLAVRLPRRSLAVPLIRNEQRWLPKVARGLPARVPVPARIGVPGCGYPWPWSVVEWIPGTPAVEAPLLSSEAPRWGVFLRGLHSVEVPASPPKNPYRGVPLAARDESFRTRLRHALAAEAIDLSLRADVERVWTAGLRASAAHRACWLHGDLHARNVLTSGGRLQGIVDWGDITVGDPAGDLASAWALFSPREHAVLWDAYRELTEPLWTRARAWACYFAIVFADVGKADDPAFYELGRSMLERVLESESPPRSFSA